MIALSDILLINAENVYPEPRVFGAEIDERL